MTKIAWEGDRQTDKLTSRLLERIGLRADSLKTDIVGVFTSFTPTLTCQERLSERIMILPLYLGRKYVIEMVVTSCILRYLKDLSILKN